MQRVDYKCKWELKTISKYLMGSHRGLVFTQWHGVEISKYFYVSFRFYVKSIMDTIKVLKIAVFAISGALNFVNLVNLSPQKVQNFIKIQISDPQFVKMADF